MLTLRLWEWRRVNALMEVSALRSKQETALHIPAVWSRGGGVAQKGHPTKVTD